jgi:G patch domain-containing protein 1
LIWGHAAGFGLGALNEAEDDDVDVYDVDFKRHGTRMAYDASQRDDSRMAIDGKSPPKSGTVSLLLPLL